MKHQSAGSVSRRKFLGQSAAAAGQVFRLFPGHVFGGAGYVPPSDKVNIAFIGVGAQGLRVMLNFLEELADVQGIAVCDVNKTGSELSPAAHARILQVRPQFARRQQWLGLA